MDQKLKRSVLAVIWSIILPGLGQIYLGKIKRGVVFLLGLSLIRILGILYLLSPNTKGFPGFLVIPDLLFYFYIAFDSYRISRRIESLASSKRCLAIYIFYIFTVGGLCLYLKENYVQVFKVPAGSMRPTIIESDQIFVDKNSYKKSEPKRGDVVVFIGPKNRKEKFVKRIVGLPNETIEIKGGAILINGIPVTQPEVIKKFYYYNCGDFAKERQQVKIPENSYFVLGDNSQSSLDSRYWGLVPKSNILGKVYKIYYPFNRSGPIN